MIPFVSICIPSYNRPESLIYLLNSIDSNLSDQIEIVICEDNSPKRLEIRNSIDEYKSKSILNILYFENLTNLGYDANLRELISRASGEYIIFMGDDDSFDLKSLGEFCHFLQNNNKLGYIMKTHTFIHHDGRKELFKYFKNDVFFEPSELTVSILFRKSVFISGFTFKRSFSLEFLTNVFDGTLLFQIYLLSELCIKYPSAYSTIPLTIQSAAQREVPMFGSAESENQLYEPGVISIDNSVNFMKGFFKITTFLDNKYNFSLTSKVRKDISKYSYPVLSIQRDKGLKIFLNYKNILRDEIKIGNSFYFSIYTFGLIVFGKKFCDSIIIFIKKILGKTPQL